eukprot:INCI4969.8.p1 GENE.INCI4969.8~~INCI4969.8.p1  ORF type:complete len:821 (-),score=122.60 INCI4969.8:49-2511(-)
MQAEVCSDTAESQDPTDEVSWIWAWILVGCATVLAFFLVLSQEVVFCITQQLGAHAVQFGLHVRSSALFNWLLLVLDFSIGFFFVLLLLVTAGLLFDGFHEAWGAPGFLAQLGQAHVVGTFSLTAVCVTFVWVALAGRVLFLAWLFSKANQHLAQPQQPQQRQQQQPPREEQEDARPQAFSGYPALDYCLFVLVGMALLWGFPWSSLIVASASEDVAQQILLVFIVWAFLLYVTLQLRNRLHRQLASIPVVTWSPLHHQAPCDGANGVTHVDVCNLKAGGWPVDKQRIFVRPQVAGQWHRLQGLLDDEDHSTLKVEGPPGTGKSTVAWAWACYMARQRSVVWVHCDRDDDNTIALLGGGRVSCWTLDAEQESRLVTDAKRIARWAGAALLIVDGIAEATRLFLTSAAGWAKAVPGRRAVTVSSVQLDVKTHIAQNLKLDKLTVYSWTKEEYTAACLDQEFWMQVKEIVGWVEPNQRCEIDDRNDNEPHFAPMTEDQYQSVLIDRKFDVAGHSARWMFFLRARTLADTTVPDCLQRVGDYHVLAQGLNGQRSNIAVNQLVAMFQQQFFPDFPLVSRFVTRYVSERCEMAFLTSAANANPNPTFDGWVLELEFLCRVRLAQSGNNDGKNYVSVYERGVDGVTTELRLCVTARVKFKSDLNSLHSCAIHDGTWFIPLEWNQGGYDAAMYRDGCLYFFQITRNTAHTEKWTHMNVLASAVHDRLVQQGVADGLQFVEHIYVLPPNVVGDFVFRTPQQMKSIPAWRNTHTRKVAFVRVAGGGNAPEAAGHEIITSRGQARDQEGGLFPRAPGNQDWRRNFPLRPE